LKPPSSLLGNADFLKLWIGESISVFGSQFSPLAIAIAAKVLLNASPIEFGILAAAGTAPFLVFGLPVGVWADRHRKKRTMIFADVGRALILLTIPVAAVFNGLSMNLFYVVAYTTGILTVFFEICYQSYLPSLVERNQLVDANSKLQASQATATSLGPATAGVVVHFFSAPLAILGDVLGYFSSATSLSVIRKNEPTILLRPGRSAWKELKEGLDVVLGDNRLRSIAASTSSANLFASAWGAIFVPYAIQELGFTALNIGVVLSLGAVGGIVGALLSRRISDRIGVGWTMILSIAIAGVAGIPVYFAVSGNAFLVLSLSFFFAYMGSVVYNVNQVSYRQALVALELQGRLNATMRTIVWGTLPLGGLLGGVLGEIFGYHAAIGIGVAAGAFAFLFMLFSPVRRVKRIPEQAETRNDPR
jgi:MFS family permease